MKVCYYTIVLLPREALKMDEERTAISGWGSLATRIYNTRVIQEFSLQNAKVASVKMNRQL